VHGTSHKLLQLDTSRKYEKKYDFVDLSYVNNDEECLLDTDDDLFQQAQSAKAWFLYKPMLMKRKGWKYEQIYSPVLFQK
jgi:hypothetical protein